MLSGFSSYLFGGNTGEESRVKQEDSVASADTSDWVFVESHPGEMSPFSVFLLSVVKLQQFEDQ